MDLILYFCPSKDEADVTKHMHKNIWARGEVIKYFLSHGEIIEKIPDMFFPVLFSKLNLMCSLRYCLWNKPRYVLYGIV